ncbi:MAG TPA: phosphate ABC transporter, permease protein PstA, partial [Solirubrobacterales bacterium]
MLSNQPRRSVIRNAVFAGLLLLAISIALAGLLALLIQAFLKGSSALSPDLFTNGPSAINPEKAGFRPAIIGSLELIAGVMLFVVPIGIGAALYLEEYADKT